MFKNRRQAVKVRRKLLRIKFQMNRLVKTWNKEEARLRQEQAK